MGIEIMPYFVVLHQDCDGHWQVFHQVVAAANINDVRKRHPLLKVEEIKIVTIDDIGSEDESRDANDGETSMYSIVEPQSEEEVKKRQQEDDEFCLWLLAHPEKMDDLDCYYHELLIPGSNKSLGEHWYESKYPPSASD